MDGKKHKLKQLVYMQIWRERERTKIIYINDSSSSRWLCLMCLYVSTMIAANAKITMQPDTLSVIATPTKSGNA